MPSVRSRVRPHDEPIASVILLDDRKFTFPSCKATDGAYPRGLDRYPPGRRGYGPACASEAWSWAAFSAPSPAVTGRWRSSSCSASVGSTASSGSSAGLAARRSRVHPGPALAERALGPSREGRPFCCPDERFGRSWADVMIRGGEEARGRTEGGRPCRHPLEGRVPRSAGGDRRTRPEDL